MTRLRQRRRAFTLIELILTMVIAVILAGLALPQYAQSISHYRVSASARRLAADISFAQARARAASTQRIISFNASTSTYQLLSEPDPVIPANTYTVNLTSAPFTSVISSVNFGSGGSVSFNAYGMPSSAGSITLQSGSVIATVTLDGSTGAVTIQ